MNQNQTNNIWTMPESLNGDRVIAFTRSKDLKHTSFYDSAAVSTYLMDEEDSTRKHLGMQSFYKTTHNVEIPLLGDLFGNAKVLEIKEGQSVTYDQPVDLSEANCYTTKDTSTETEEPGSDNRPFDVVLNLQFQPGDILTYDAMYGDQVIVSEDHRVEMDGEGWRHTVYLQTTDPDESFDPAYLKDGIEWFKLSNKTPELGENFSSINLMNRPVGSITCEFLMPDVRTVETFMTRKAANMEGKGFRGYSDAMAEGMVRKMANKSLTNGNDVFMMADLTNGGVTAQNAKIGSTLEYLMLMEIAMMEAYEIMFAKAAVQHTSKGSLRTAEGLWHTMRRGKIIRYTKATGITKNHLEELSQYIYKNANVNPKDRVIMLKGGWFAIQEVLELFRQEAIQEISRIPASFLGTDRQVEGRMLSGSLDDLELNTVEIRTVTFPSIGKIKVEYDPSMDYQPMADRFSAKTYGHGKNRNSYSLVAYDLTSSQYSNVKENVKGAKLIDGGNETSNIYYVKKEGEPVVTWGYEQGRMADGAKASNVISSMKKMGKSLWAISDSAGLMIDSTRYVTIELQEN